MTSSGTINSDPFAGLYLQTAGYDIASGNAIKDSTMGGMVIHMNSNDDKSVGLWFGTNNAHWSGISGQRTNSASTWGTDLRFYTHEDATNDLTYARERLRITSAGKVLIGTSTPQGNANADDLVVSTASAAGMTIRSGTSSNGSLFFADGTSGADEYRGWVQYNHTNNYLTFGTNAQERLRIDSSGRTIITNDAVTNSTGTNTQYAHLTVRGNSTATSSRGAFLNFARSEASANIANNEEIACIWFGDQQAGEYGSIKCQADADAAVGDYPGRLTFWTTADGGTTMSERLRIDSSGNLHLRSASTCRLVLGSSGGSVGDLTNNENWIRGSGTMVQLNTAGGDYGFEVLGDQKMKLDSSGNLELRSATQNRITFGSAGSSGNDTNWVRGDGNDLMYNCITNHKWEISGTEVLRIQSNSRIYQTCTTDITPNSSYDAQFRIVANGYTGGIGFDGSSMYVGHNSPNRHLNLQTNYTNRLTIKSDGRISFGGLDPANYYSTYDDFVWGATSGSVGMTIVSGSSDAGYLTWADGTSSADQYRGRLFYNHSDNSFNFRCNGLAHDIFKINSSQVYITSTSTDGVLNLDTSSSNGTFIRFKQGGTTKHWIGCATGLGGHGDNDDLALRATDNIKFMTTTSNVVGNFDANGAFTTPKTPAFKVTGHTSAWTHLNVASWWAFDNGSNGANPRCNANWQWHNKGFNYGGASNNGCFSTTTGRFTAPVAGHYYFWYIYYMQRDSGNSDQSSYIHINPCVNASNYGGNASTGIMDDYTLHGRTNNYASQNNLNGVTGSWGGWLAAGDTFEFKTYNSNNTNGFQIYFGHSAWGGWLNG